MTTLPSDENESLISRLHSHGLSTSCDPGAAIAAFRRDLIFLLQEAAAGRRENGGVGVLKKETATLETVVRLVEGDMTAMTARMPSWRWTDEMLEGA